MSVPVAPLPAPAYTTPEREHFDKYEALARDIGVDALRAILPASRGEIAAALAAGDTALNTIPLPRWDKAAGAVPVGHNTTTLTDFRWGPVPPAFARHAHLSLGERVCVLKHVARRLAE